MNENFARIERLPTYVFAITNELKAKARSKGEDIIDFGMGNPDQPTPQHIVDKLVEVAQRTDTHVVLDNASIHKGYEVFDIANDFGINILYLPPYSPDLNPIEKVWANFKNKLRRIRHLYTSFNEAVTAAWNLMKTLSG